MSKTPNEIHQENMRKRNAAGQTLAEWMREKNEDNESVIATISDEEGRFCGWQDNVGAADETRPARRRRV